MSSRGMTSKQQAFVDEYQIDRNATQAAIRAGYSERRAKQTGFELLQKPHVAAAIAKRDRERQEELGVDADWIVARLIAIHEKAFTGAPKTNRDGDPIVVDGVQVMEWSPSGAVRPLEVLMKHLGIEGTSKHELSVTGEAGVVYTLTLDRELPELDTDDA